MAKKTPVTPAVRVLRDAQVGFTPYVYEYGRYPGALGAAEFIGIDPHLTAKTIVLATSAGAGVVVLMNGDREVSTKSVARMLGEKTVEPASQRQGTAWTGYQFGGTSPLGMKTDLPVFAQPEIAEFETVYVNAGKKGFVVGLDPGDLLRLTSARLVDLAA